MGTGNAASSRAASLFAQLDLTDLSRRSTRNIGINLAAQGVRFVLQIVSTIALARLLTPADFGLVAMVTVLVNFVGLFKEAGLAQATVQRESITHEQISSLYWINIAITVGLGLAILALAPAIVWIYDEPRLLGLAMVLALPIMISGFGLQHRALLQRHMRFVAINRIEILSQALAVCAGITAALYGLGYWSLAVMSVVLAVARNAGFMGATGWRPCRPGRGTGVRGMLRFGANLTGFNFINYLSRNADNFLIGKFIGPAALGQYSRAYGLMILPISQINAPIANALLPTLSRLQNNRQEFTALFVKWIQRVAWLTAIPVASAAIWGKGVVLFLLGHEWNLAAEIFHWLVIASFLHPVASLSGLAYVASGKTSKMLKWSIFGASVRVVGFFIGVFYFGALGVAQSYAITSIMLLPLMAAYLERNIKGLGIAAVKAVMPPAIVSMVLIVIGIRLQ